MTNIKAQIRDEMYAIRKAQSLAWEKFDKPFIIRLNDADHAIFENWMQVFPSYESGSDACTIMGMHIDRTSGPSHLLGHHGQYPLTLQGEAE